MDIANNFKEIQEKGLMGKNDSSFYISSKAIIEMMGQNEFNASSNQNLLEKLKDILTKIDINLQFILDLTEVPFLPNDSKFILTSFDSLLTNLKGKKPVFIVEKDSPLFKTLKQSALFDDLNCADSVEAGLQESFFKGDN